MKIKLIPIFLVVICLLAACQTEPPPPTTASVSQEITLAPEQSAVVTGTDLTIVFHSVISDERCPKDIECFASGPVTLSLSVQQGDGAPSDFTLQTFTDQDGRSPNVQFEGITSRAEVGEYSIQVTGVTPYPTSSNTEIESSAYRVLLLVTSK